MACNFPGITIVGSMLIAANNGDRTEMKRLTEVIRDDQEKRQEFYEGFAGMTDCDSQVIASNYSEILLL